MKAEIPPGSWVIKLIAENEAEKGVLRGLKRAEQEECLTVLAYSDRKTGIFTEIEEEGQVRIPFLTDAPAPARMSVLDAVADDYPKSTI